MDGVMILATICAVMSVGVLIIFYTIVMENLDNIGDWRKVLQSVFRKRRKVNGNRRKTLDR